jgi:TetR/AcrR family transcriptional repressor of nem operon
MPRKKEYIEEEVLDKAMHIFWKNGYEGTSIRTLEKGMGINQFSIYANFRSKNDLLIESLKHYQQKIYSGLLSGLDQSTGGTEEIRNFFYKFIDFVKVDNKANGCLLTNTMLEMGQKDKKVEAVITSFIEKVRLIFARAVNKAKERGEIGPGTDTSAYVNYLMGVLQGLAASTKFFNRKQISDYIEVAIKSVK